MMSMDLHYHSRILGFHDQKYRPTYLHEEDPVLYLRVQVRSDGLGDQGKDLQREGPTHAQQKQVNEDGKTGIHMHYRQRS
jgi:hypothetical protein